MIAQLAGESAKTGFSTLMGFTAFKLTTMMVLTPMLLLAIGIGHSVQVTRRFLQEQEDARHQVQQEITPDRRAAHALVADQDVLDGVVQRMAHVQAAGDVRRRDHHREGLSGGAWIGMEGSGLLPGPLPAGVVRVLHRQRRQLRRGCVR